MSWLSDTLLKVVEKGPESGLKIPLASCVQFQWLFVAYIQVEKWQLGFSVHVCIPSSLWKTAMLVFYFFPGMSEVMRRIRHGALGAKCWRIPLDTGVTLTLVRRFRFVSVWYCVWNMTLIDIIFSGQRKYCRQLPSTSASSKMMFLL